MSHPPCTASSTRVEAELRRALAAAEAARDAAEAECRSIIDSIGEVVFRTDAEGRWTMLTPAWEAITGCTVAESLGRSFLDFVHPDDRAEQWSAFERLVTMFCETSPHRVRYQSADGTPRWIEARLRLVVDEAGRAVGTLGTLNDVTAQQLEREARIETETRLRLALEVAGLVVWERAIDGDDAGVVLTRDGELSHGVRARSSSFADYLEMVHPDDRASTARAVRDAIARDTEHGEASLRHTCRLVAADGAVVWTDNLARIVHDGRARRMIGVSADITAQRDAELARERKHSLLAATLEATGDGIIVVGLDGDITSHNQRMLELWGLPHGDYVGRRLVPVLRHVMPQLVDPDAMWHLLAAVMSEPAAEHSALVHWTDGRICERTVRPQWLDGHVIGHVWSCRDVTARAELEARLTHQAYHDALTGLANRTQLRLRVEHALEHARLTGRSADHIAVLLLDLDGFKLVNDAAGHAAGDALLRQVAERLLNATRGCDVVARLGGDEFGVLLERVRSNDDVVVVAERIVHALREPFTVLGTTVVVGTSIGIARGEDDGLRGPAGEELPPVDALLRNADLALYEAKGRGKGQHALFEPSMHEVALERVSLESALRRGLERDEFWLAFQPIVDLETARPTGVEALVRWQHPTRGLVPPSHFVPLAEETGLVIPLGTWVLRAACREAVRWPGAETLTVNVSGRQLATATFVHEVRTALDESGLPASRLLLEITETAVIRQPDVALERLTALKALGVRLAIDDFGTGYSALGYLQRFPFDVLKIDKRFVDRVAEGGQHAALASAIVAIGHALALTTVAEGVETEAQRDALRAMGCRCGQGYLFARPLDAGSLAERLASSGSASTASAFRNAST